MTANAALVVSAAIQAIATVVLVGVTIFYAFQTKKTVEAMENSNKLEFLPILQIGFYINTCTDRRMDISLTNIGKGIAKKPVKVTVPGAADIIVNSIPVGEDSKVSITHDMDYILQLPEDQRKLTVSYQDVFGRTITTVARLIETSRDQDGTPARYLSQDTWEPVLP